MRAKEFITETRRGKPLDAQAKVSPGTMFTIDGVTNLYRAASIMGRTPADVSDIDPYSFVTNLPMIVTYTDQERDMVRKAFNAMGIPYSEQIPKGSEEPDGVHKISPIKGFEGY